MATLLTKWLNDEVNLSKRVSNFEEAFQNGYLFGEILHKFNQQNNFRDFVNTRTADSKVRNFILLEPVLRRLGIPLSSGNAFQIMSGHKGAAMRVIYSLKVAIQKLQSLPKVGQRVVNGIKPLTNMTEKLSRPSFDKKNSELFEHAIRNLVENENNVMMERHLQKYTARQTVLLQNAEEAKKAEHRAELARIDAIRRAGREKLEAAKLAQVGVGNEVWRKNITTRTMDLERQTQFQAQSKAKAITRRLAKQKSIRDRTLSDLDSFDKRLASGTITNINPEDSSSIADQSQQPAAEDNQTFEGRIAAQIASTNMQRQDAQNYLKDLTSKKVIVNAARKERARRRNQFLTDVIQDRTKQVSSSLEKDLHRKAIRSTQVEKDIDNNHRIIRAFKQVMLDNRSFREESYAGQREVDRELFDARELAFLGAHVSSFELDVFKGNLQHSDRLRWEQEKVHCDVRTFCGHLIDGIVDVSLQVAHFRSLKFGNHRPKPSPLSELQVPDPVLKEIMIAFHSNQVQRQSNITTCEIGDKKHQHNVAMVEYNSYLSQTGLWHIPKTAKHSQGENEGEVTLIEEGDKSTETKEDVQHQAESNPTHGGTTMAEIVQLLAEVADPCPPIPELPACLKFPLQVCLLGKRCSGKTRQARMIADRFNVDVIVYDDLVAATIDDIYAETISVDNQLATEVRNALESGLDVDDDMAVRLVIDAIQRVQSDRQGWVLDGWPTTLVQAQKLHETLTGYSPEKSAARLPINRGSKMLSPPIVVKEPEPPKLFDLVLRFDNDTETLFRRGFGAREDTVRPENGVFHLDDSLEPRAGSMVPLGVDANRVVSRLQMPRALVSEVQAAADLAALQDWRSAELEWWYNRFGNFEALDTACVTDANLFAELVAPRCEAVVATKEEARQIALDQKNQAERAAAHSQLLRDFAHIKGTYETERPAKPTPEEAAQIEALTAAAAKKGKQPKLPPPRMERLELTITAEGFAILPLETEDVNADEAELVVGKDGENNEQEDTQPQVGMRERVKLARFGRDVLLLPNKSRFNLTFEPEPEEGSDKYLQREIEVARAAALGETPKDPLPQPVATVTREDDNLTFTRIEEPPTDPEPEPDPNLVSTPRKLVKSIRPDGIKLLHSEINAMEFQFKEMLISSFMGLMTARANSMEHLQVQQQAYVKFLLRGDSAQQVVDNVIKSLNDIPGDMRSDDGTKAELHQRISDAVKQLMTMIQKRREQNDEQLKALEGNEYLKNSLLVLEAHLCTLVQAELERCNSTRQFLADVYSLRCFQCLTELDIDLEVSKTGTGAGNVVPSLGPDSETNNSKHSKKKHGTKKSKKGAEEAHSPSEHLDACVISAEAAVTEFMDELLLSMIGNLTKDAGMADDAVNSSLEAKTFITELNGSLERIRHIGTIGANLCAEFQNHYKDVYSKLKQYGRERIAHESAVVDTLSRHLRQIVESENVVEYDLQIEHDLPQEPALLKTGHNGLTRLVEKRAIRNVPRPLSAPVRNVQTIDSVACSRLQLLNLAKAFRAASQATFLHSNVKIVSSMLPIETVAQVIQKQIALHQTPVAWITDEESSPDQSWTAALLQFALHANETPSVGVTIDWRTLLMSLWETSLQCEGRGGALGSSEGSSDLSKRVSRLHRSYKVLRNADAEGVGFVTRETLSSLPRSMLWFGEGDANSSFPVEQLNDEEVMEEAQIAARHYTTLDFVVAGWGIGDRVDYISFLGYASGAGSVSRKAAVTAAIASFSKNISASGGNKSRKHDSTFFLSSDNVHSVFASTRGYASEANIISKAMRRKSVLKLSVSDVLNATADSNSHLIPVFEPCLR